MKLVLRGPCVQDLQDARAWYDAQRSGLADEFREAMAQTLATIAEHPLRFRVACDTRQALVRRFPYRLLYRVGADAILVIACYHAHRDPRLWTTRS